MDKESSEIDWSQVEHPLPSSLFDKYTHQCLVPPLSSLGLSDATWNEYESFAAQLGERGFLDPTSILYTSFKRSYNECPSLRSFIRWLNLRSNLEIENKSNGIHPANFQSIGELIRSAQTLKPKENLSLEKIDVEQIWFFISVSLRLPSNGVQLLADATILDDGITRPMVRSKKSHSSRIHCLFALTPSGKFSNQFFLFKQSRTMKINLNSSSFARFVQTNNGEILADHLEQWLDDFLSFSFVNEKSAILFDPRTTLITPEFQRRCENRNVQLFTIDFDSYLCRILSPICSLWDKKWSEANRIDKMFLRSPFDLRRIVHSFWFSLRMLKENEEIQKVFRETPFWRRADENFLQSLKKNNENRTNSPKKKKKKLSMKTGNKTKTGSTTMMADPPADSTAEEIFSFVVQRQLSVSRASKFLGGMKLDYLKICLSNKSSSNSINVEQIKQLNTFMHSTSTADWLRFLRSIYFWPCAKQIFLREIYRWTGVVDRKRSTNIGGNGNIGSIRSCDFQSPGSFWKSFEEIHQLQIDNETIGDQDQWQNDFQDYLTKNKLDHDQTQLWTLDTFEFPLIKKSTVLQLPEWNELRPLNLTPKVTVIYAFSNRGQFIEPTFIFPKMLSETMCVDHLDPNDFYNEQGHLTPDVFLSWFERNFLAKVQPAIVLILCSRLPILSPSVSEKLKISQVYPFGYPYARTLPFRYLFERRVRNNRSTNLMSELWKKKLLDEQRTHVLKDSACTVKNIKYYFQQIWSQLLHEKQNDDDDDQQQTKTIKTWSDQCQQAFQQANIQIKVNRRKVNSSRKSKRSRKISDSNDEQIVEQLNHLLTVIGQVKDKISSASPSQILKMNNHIEETNEELMTNGETSDHHPSGSSPSSSSSSSTPIISNSNPTVFNTIEKRSIDENDQPRLSKRLRSSFTQVTTAPGTVSWIPPSKQLVTRIQSQSSSLFQFILLLIRTILTSSDDRLTNEHSRWLHSTVKSYDDQCNTEKINLLIETACKVAQISFVR